LPRQPLSEHQGSSSLKDRRDRRDAFRRNTMPGLSNATAIADPAGLV